MPTLCLRCRVVEEPAPVDRKAGLNRRTVSRGGLPGMRLVIRATKKHESVYEHAERRVGLVLSRFAPRVLSVSVVVTDADDDDGDLALCTVRVRSGGLEIVEEVADDDPRVAVE